MLQGALGAGALTGLLGFRMAKRQIDAQFGQQERQLAHDRITAWRESRKVVYATVMQAANAFDEALLRSRPEDNSWSMVEELQQCASLAVLEGSDAVAESASALVEAAALLFLAHEPPLAMNDLDDPDPDPHSWSAKDRERHQIQTAAFRAARETSVDAARTDLGGREAAAFPLGEIE